MGSLDRQIKTFVDQMDSQGNRHALLTKIQSFFTGAEGRAAKERHLIYKRSILYFFQNHDVVEAMPCGRSVNSAVLTFDGEKISRIMPVSLATSGQSRRSRRDSWDWDINNNNNNNNNNGNNNG
jgi:hypothetical protein